MACLVSCFESLNYLYLLWKLHVWRCVLDSWISMNARYSCQSLPSRSSRSAFKGLLHLRPESLSSLHFGFIEAYGCKMQLLRSKPWCKLEMFLSCFAFWHEASVGAALSSSKWPCNVSQILSFCPVPKKQECVRQSEANLCY